MASHQMDSDILSFHSKLIKNGVEIEEFENDSFHKLVFESEKILQGNQIELLLWSKLYYLIYTFI